MKVYELHTAFLFAGVWRPSGGSTGTLYATLQAAQESMPGWGWCKHKARRIWETERGDIISERRVKP